MTDEQREAETAEMMHQQWAAPVAGAVDDDDDEPMTYDAPTPTADELARLRARVAELEAQLAAVPTNAIWDLYVRFPADKSGEFSRQLTAIWQWLNSRQAVQP
jgi:hypothetical protein